MKNGFTQEAPTLLSPSSTLNSKKKLLLTIRQHFFFVLASGMLINSFIKFDTHVAFAAGLFLGAMLSVIKVLLMEQGIDSLLSKQPSHAGIYAVLQISLRNILTAGLISCALLIDSISIWGVVAGMLLLKSSALSVK